MPGKRYDLSNMAFGELKVSNVYDNGEWLCYCSCGNHKWAKAHALTSGSLLSCGCYNRKVHSKNYVGLRSGMLVAIERISDGKGDTRYKCRCDCGNIKFVSNSNLRMKLVGSCGCNRWNQFRAARKKKALKRYGVASFNRAIETYKRRSRNQGFEFSLSEDEFRNLTSERCHYCHSPPSNTSKSQHGIGDYVYNGLDRIDNDKGYTIDNVVPCCANCNKTKRDMSVDDFLSMVSKIYNHRVLLEQSKTINWNVA